MTKRGNGEGSIYQRRDGRWVAALVADGRRRYVYGQTRTTVARKLTAALTAREGGAPIAGARLTFGGYWHTWHPAVRWSLAPRTWELYEQIGRTHLVPILGRVPLSRLRPDHVRALHAAMLDAGRSPTTAHHAHRLLHRVLADAAREELVPRNVAGLVAAPRVATPELTTLTASQARDLLAAARGDRYEALYVLAVTTGMRQGELLGLRWGDIDVRAGMCRITRALHSGPDGPSVGPPKTRGSQRAVALSVLALDALRRHRRAQATERLAAGAAWRGLAIVFPNRLGAPMERRNFLRREFEPLRRRAGLPPVRFHDLRHTAATLALGQGVHPKVVSEMLGHATIGITLDRYSHVTLGMQREASQRMGALLAGSPAAAAADPEAGAPP